MHACTSDLMPATAMTMASDRVWSSCLENRNWSLHTGRWSNLKNYCTKFLVVLIIIQTITNTATASIRVNTLSSLWKLTSLMRICTNMGDIQCLFCKCIYLFLFVIYIYIILLSQKKKKKKSFPWKFWAHIVALERVGFLHGLQQNNTHNCKTLM